MAKQTFTTGQVLTAAQMTSLQQTAMGGGTAVVKTASYVLTAADAGTVIQMNSASSTTITVNTALFSAGDAVWIQNIGAGVCTITAGTATVTTAGSLALVQWEGGQLYFTSASASIFFDYIQAGVSIPLTTKGDLFGYDTGNARIPVGSDSQVLTADSTQPLGLKWATPTDQTPLTTKGDLFTFSTTDTRLGVGTDGQVLTATSGNATGLGWATPSSGGMTLISSTTLSGTTTIGSIPQTYNTLTGVIFSATNASGVGRIRIAPNGSTTLSSAVMTFAASSTTTSSENYESNYWFLTNSSGTWNALNYNAISFTIYNYTSTARKAIAFFGSYLNSSGGFLQNISGAGQNADTSAISSLTFTNSGGSFNGGTVLLYGVK